MLSLLNTWRRPHAKNFRNDHTIGDDVQRSWIRHVGRLSILPINPFYTRADDYIACGVYTLAAVISFMKSSRVLI